MTAMSNKRHQGVPAISQTALNAVSDPNVRKVLQDMANGLNVRNGTAGDGDQQFITRAELRIAGVDIGAATDALKRGWQAGPQYLKPSDIPGLINQVQNEIRNSLLWKELGERIELINIDISKNGVNFFQEKEQRINADNAIIIRTDQQYAVLNGNYAVLQQKYTTMANNVAAYSQLLTDLQVKVGQNAAAIQQETSARASADGQMMAKYTVKIDMNGYVSGYGLMSEANNGAVVSSFIVRADRFAVGSPSTGNAVPFVVYTSPRNLNGVTAPAGVYIEDAFIANGMITTAKIGLAQIDTLQVAGNAVTTMFASNAAQWGDIAVPAGGWTIVARLYASMPAGASGIAFIGVLSGMSLSGGTLYARIYRESVSPSNAVGFSDASFSGGDTNTMVVIGHDTSPPAGSTTYLLVAENPTSGPGANKAFVVTRPNLLGTGSKR